MRKVLYIFGLLGDADVEWIARTGVRRRLVDGDVIIQEGQHVDFLVFVLEGELLVTTRRLGEIARLGVGEVVGEISLVDSAPPSATVAASRSSLTLLVDKAKLTKKLEADEGFGHRFYRALSVFLADRLREARGGLPASPDLLGDSAISQDELDTGILDRVSGAGERFSRMLRLLSGGGLPN
jgi:CRP/FNR family transcriptional regulator, cyclic AMP receptor protein